GVERELQGARGRATNKGVVATFPGIEDRDAAEALTGAEVWVERSQLPPPKPGEYYWVDLEGLQVVNLEGTVLGTVSHLLNTGANDIMSVAGDRERLIPFIEDDFVKSVDFATRVITVDWDADF
ncbi:MAG: ribosome maturation factor RimM, partial [Arenimonas sp.]